MTRTVFVLKIKAQQSLGLPFLRLAAPDGRLVDPTQTLQDSGLQSGDSITAVAQQSKVAVKHRAMVFVVRWR